jgi:hypothetical protein
MLGAFDLLKNMGVDMTTFIVPCLIQKLVMRLDKIGPSLNHKTTFYPRYNYKKDENIHFIFEYKNIIFLSLTDAILFYSDVPSDVLFCLILFFQVLIVLQIKDTLRLN